METWFADDRVMEMWDKPVKGSFCDNPAIFISTPKASSFHECKNCGGTTDLSKSHECRYCGSPLIKSFVNA